MSSRSSSNHPHQHAALRVLIIDDESRFRTNLVNHLEQRGILTEHTDDPEEGLRMLRENPPDVAILETKLPKTDGQRVLREIKHFAPEVQVVILTRHASTSSAVESGRLDAFAYLEKPCELDELVTTLHAAGEKKRAFLPREILATRPKSMRQRLWGTHGFRPLIMALGALLFALLLLLPTPESLVRLLESPRAEQPVGDPIFGYATYHEMKVGETIARHYSEQSNQFVETPGPEDPQSRPLNGREAGFRAKAMVGIVAVATLFWATGAIPVGVTAVLVALLMYGFGVFSPDLVAKAYARDTVVFILGILILAQAMAKTGLDRRLGLLLLRMCTSLPMFLFCFIPLLAVCASFFSGHVWVAILVPIMIVAYRGAVRAAGIARDRSLAVLLILPICFAANQGGVGSPAAGGRHALMIGILEDHGSAPSFAEWMAYGLPFVPVISLVIAAYFFLVLRRRLALTHVDFRSLMGLESQKQGPIGHSEYVTIVILVIVFLLWLVGPAGFGLGGPVLVGIIALSIFRILSWVDMRKISWEVVTLYACASALAAGLAATGASLWLAKTMIDLLPNCFLGSTGLALTSSALAVVLTNFMSDGATVAALGPIAVPLANVAGASTWVVGLSIAIASSFANVLIIGTPNNAIAYSLAKDVDTGEQLVTLGDFAKHGLAVTILSLLVFWGWAVFGYWRWVGFPA